MRELPIPPHFRPELVGDVWRVEYAERARDARRWARTYGVRPASKDDLRVALLLIDVQNTFCVPGFELFVAGRSGLGAVEDNVRLCQFVYRNLENITRIYLTMDTHQAYQIFHETFLVDRDGNHPEPYTRISVEDVRRGRWSVDPEACNALGVSREWAQRHLLHYVESLERSGKYELTIWPFHAMLGGIGHAIVSAVEEAVFFHSIARASQPFIRIKGTNPFTEHYSALQPEVKTGPDGEKLGALDVELVQELSGYDVILVAGQAKSHCVAWTVEDLINAFKERDPALVNKVFLLDDCSSPVVVKGVVDYTEAADLYYRKFASEGARIVRSTESMSSWLTT
ncbi:MAG: cysteine hydrolase family protein [Thaumarchaeota archaeon]|nr:cysteine hydrolase family protein [Candidatus Calditenuaceae archaeon]MDW8043566.1 cysteine hydrolase family protein [Nitrososphaerota archaeon]